MGQPCRVAQQTSCDSFWLNVRTQIQSWRPPDCVPTPTGSFARGSSVLTGCCGLTASDSLFPDQNVSVFPPFLMLLALILFPGMTPSSAVQLLAIFKGLNVCHNWRFSKKQQHQVATSWIKVLFHSPALSGAGRLATVACVLKPGYHIHFLLYCFFFFFKHEHSV